VNKYYTTAGNTTCLALPDPCPVCKFVEEEEEIPVIPIGAGAALLVLGGLIYMKAASSGDKVSPYDSREMEEAIAAPTADVWKKSISRTKGVPYWLNTVTGEIVWEDPTILDSGVGSSENDVISVGQGGGGNRHHHKHHHHHHHNDGAV
jgi:hypothetical protein